MALIERVTGKQNFEMAGLSVMQSGTMQIRVRGLGSRGRFSFYVSEADSSPSFPSLQRMAPSRSRTPSTPIPACRSTARTVSSKSR